MANLWEPERNLWSLPFFIMTHCQVGTLPFFLFIDSNSHHNDFQNYQGILKAAKLFKLFYISHGKMGTTVLLLCRNKLDAGVAGVDVLMILCLMVYSNLHWREISACSVNTSFTSQKTLVKVWIIWWVSIVKVFFSFSFFLFKERLLDVCRRDMHVGTLDMLL